MENKVVSSELKFKFDKKGRLKVVFKEKEKNEAGDTITYKSPEKHDIRGADEEAVNMLVKALLETTERFLSGQSVDYFNKDKQN